VKTVPCRGVYPYYIIFAGFPVSKKGKESPVFTQVCLAGVRLGSEGLAEHPYRLQPNPAKKLKAGVFPVGKSGFDRFPEIV
jgi:hypothetical protein